MAAAKRNCPVCLVDASFCVQSGLINQFPFDPAGMNSKDMAVKEVKNGRLAMVSISISIRSSTDHSNTEQQSADPMRVGSRSLCCASQPLSLASSSQCWMD